MNGRKVNYYHTLSAAFCRLEDLCCQADLFNGQAKLQGNSEEQVDI